MTTQADQVELAFPLAIVDIHDDRVIVRLDRDQLPRLANFLGALQLGLVDIKTQPRGHG